MRESDVRTDLVEAVRDYMSDTAVPLDMATKIKDLGLDSIDLLELLLKIEETFDIELDVVAFEKCETLGEVAKHIANVK